MISKQALKAPSVLKQGYVRSFCLPLCCTFRHLQHAAQACFCNSAAYHCVICHLRWCENSCRHLESFTEQDLSGLHIQIPLLKLVSVISRSLVDRLPSFFSMTDVWLAANFSQAPRQHIKEACVARFMVCVGLKFIGWWFGFKSSFHLIKDTSISFPSSQAKRFSEILRL